MELQNKQEDDRISLLPDHIIHEFLSLLDTKAVARSCVLSKTWQRAWASFPRIDFNQYYFNARECEHPKYSPTTNIEIRMKKDAFLSYIDNSLQSRLELEHVEEFTLIFSHHDKELVLPRVIKWLTFAIERNVKVLTLNLGVRDFIIPQVLLEAKTISELRLTSAKLESNNKFKFSHLKKLGLNHVHLDEQVIQNLTLTCPLIEDFQLHSCHGLKQLKLSNLSRIKLLDLCIGIEVSRIEIEAPSLQTFCYRWDMCGYPLENNRYCDICLEGCKKLKTLNLVSHHEMPIELLQNLSSKFPTLEVLHISNCKMPSIKISCQTLKEFTLNSCYDLEVVEVNTPNLVSLCCKRNKLPFYSFNTPSLQKLELDFDLGFPTLFPPWFDKLKEFVGKFNNSEGLNMVIHSNCYVVILQDGLNENTLSSLIDFKELGARIVISCMSLSNLVEKLFFQCPVKILSIVSSSSKCLEVLNEKLINRHFKSMYMYPLHCIDEVKVIDSLDGEADYQNFKWITLLKSYETMDYHTTSFKLKWKSMFN